MLKNGLSMPTSNNVNRQTVGNFFTLFPHEKMVFSDANRVGELQSNATETESVELTGIGHSGYNVAGDSPGFQRVKREFCFSWQ